jgi:DNA ligase-1
MSKPFRPMLAEDYVEDKLRWGGWASSKYDGIRSTILQGTPTTRSGKDVPNPMVKELFGKLEFADGELIYGDPCDPDVYNNSYSAFMTSNPKKLDLVDPALIKFFPFDHVERLDDHYCGRYTRLDNYYGRLESQNVFIVEQYPVPDALEFDRLEELWLGMGFEGMMYRDPTAPYKQGRATVEQGWLLKVKRFVDCEAEIIGFEEETKNTNEATVNEIGYTKRSTRKEGLVGKGTLGKLIVRGINGRWAGVEWRIGIGKGLTARLRQQIWDNREKFLGQIIVCTYFPIGAKDRPRFPKWNLKGFRSPLDM